MIQTITISVIIRAFAVLILLTSVLPRMWIESRVPNGLGKLRRSIFLGGFIYCLMNIIFFAYNLFRVFGYENAEMSNNLSILASSSALVIAMVLRTIYKDDYGTERKHREKYTQKPKSH